MPLNLGLPANDLLTDFADIIIHWNPAEIAEILASRPLGRSIIVRDESLESHMPTLEFKGKPFVYSHHLSVPFRELIFDAKKSLPGGKKASLEDTQQHINDISGTAKASDALYNLLRHLRIEPTPPELIDCEIAGRECMG